MPINIEGILLWITVVGYFISSLTFLASVVFQGPRQKKLAWIIFLAGAAAHTATIAARWISSGHPPVLGPFEHALAGSWFIAMIYAGISIFRRRVVAVGLVAAPFVLLMLGYGIMGNPSIVEPLPPPYKSNWLWIHVSFAWICYGAFHVSAALGVLYLLKGRFAGRPRQVSARAGRVFGLLDSLPEQDRLDDINFKLIVYGFISHVVMLGSGAIWAYGLWGRYWAWDPIETWSLISWVIYGICIHLRMSYGWRGRKFAWLSIIAVIAILVTFGGIGFIGGTHTPLLQ